MKRHLLWLLLLVVGCECPPDFEGKVVKKIFTHAYTSVMPIYHSNGKGGGYYTYIPIYHPDEFRIRVGRPALRYKTWYGKTLSPPQPYIQTEDFLTDVISFSQYQVGTPVTIERWCRQGKEK